DRWFIGAMTDENPRDFEVDLSFIPKEFNQIEFLADGMNAERVAIDYKKGETPRTEKNTLKIHLAPGGGYVAIISKGK
ncbi:MAG: glycoside hydrolase family 97 C-terminal domain-containing protein, partial [Salinivirgaceae bacterium]|nr:glycoside hydrolase family 97 C-terminal domain-containing protein [Salinivirgaceae bacterium]